MDSTERVTVLFVCLGNICRSPAAEGVFSRLVREAGLQERIVAASAGTHDFNLGLGADAGAWRAAGRRGVDLSAHRARQVSREDCLRADYVVAMDAANLRALHHLCPAGVRARLHLLTDFAARSDAREVPDPYGGSDEDFERVLDLVESGARGLLSHIVRTRLG